MSDYTLRKETFASIFPEVLPLIVQHWEEVENDKAHIPLVPDFDKYELLEKSGVLRVFTIRYFGKLVGYNLFIVDKGLHHKTMTFASGDVFFVEQDHRTARNGFRLLEYSEKLLKVEGVDVIIMHSKYGTQLHKLYERNGYEADERAYRKLLRRS